MKHFWVETKERDKDARALILKCARENCAAQWLISPAPKGARYRVKGEDGAAVEVRRPGAEPLFFNVTVSAQRHGPTCPCGVCVDKG